MFEIFVTDFPLDCFLVPSTSLLINLFDKFGAFNFVQGSFKAGPNCYSMCLIPAFPPAKWNVRNVPINDHLKPGPSSIALSKSSVVA